MEPQPLIGITSSTRAAGRLLPAARHRSCIPPPEVLIACARQLTFITAVLPDIPKPVLGSISQPCCTHPQCSIEYAAYRPSVAAQVQSPALLAKHFVFVRCQRSLKGVQTTMALPTRRNILLLGSLFLLQGAIAARLAPERINLDLEAAMSIRPPPLPPRGWAISSKELSSKY